MALILPGRFVFLHVPKTGGNWVRRVLETNFEGVELDLDTVNGNPWAPYGHNDLADVGHRAPFRFAFVRHPVDFWRSFWRYRMRKGWQSGHEIDSRCADDDFDRYVDKVVSNLPGYASRMFSRFVGDPVDEIEFIGKQESLAEDLSAALRLCGCGLPATAFDGAPKNASADGAADFTVEQRTALSFAEREGIERFGYG